MRFILCLFIVTVSFSLMGCVDNEDSKVTQETLKPLETLTALTPTIGITSIPLGTTETHIYRPVGEGPFPAVYFLQGYPCRTINPSHEKSKVRAGLIRDYVKAGFLVYMVEKPGMGELSDEASSRVSCKDISYQDEVAAFSAAFANLENHPDVKRDQIFLFGHSMGGQTAPLIAQDHDVAGIMTYGIHAKPWFEFMIDISRAQGERLGIDPVILQKETGDMVPFLYDLMIAKEDWDTLSERHAAVLSGGVMPANGQYINGRKYSFWSSLNDADFVSAWGNFKGHVLAMYGAYDIASISSEGAERIVNIVNFHNPENATLKILENTDHNFAYFEGSFDAYKSKRFSKDWTDDYVASLTNPNISQDTISWMNDVIAASESESE